MELWAHQSRALVQAREAIQVGHRRVLIVSPTGSGKGTLATEILRRAVAQGKRGIFLIHRREIIDDVHARLTKAGVRAGVILPDRNQSPYAPVQVCSVQTLTARGARPPADIVIADECHHIQASTWAKLVACYPDAILIGLTATPARADGRPLSQFEHMIVAAQYSELIAQGLIVPAKVFQPAQRQENALALDPVAAFKQYAPQSKGFCFVGSLELGADVTRRFKEAGVPAVTIEGKTEKRVRDRAIADLRAGRVQVLVNVNCLTEGVDAADADLCILASANNHCGTYLQRVGRVLRSAPGKTHAIVLDLVGASLVHGLPHVDREYSLSGKAIGLSNLPPLCVCAQCGLTQLGGRLTCEGCGFKFLRKERKVPYIGSESLRLVYDWENTPTENKLDYWLDLVQHEPYIDRCIARYRDVFFDDPPIEWRAALPREVKVRAVEHWKQQAQERGWKRGYAYARAISVFGSAP